MHASETVHVITNPERKGITFTSISQKANSAWMGVSNHFFVEILRNISSQESINQNGNRNKVTLKLMPDRKTIGLIG